MGVRVTFGSTSRTERLRKGQRVCPIDCSALCHFCSAWRREKPAASMSRALRHMAATNANSAANRKMALTKVSMSPGVKNTDRARNPRSIPANSPLGSFCQNFDFRIIYLEVDAQRVSIKVV